MQHRLGPLIIPRPRVAPPLDWLIPLAFLAALLPGGVFISVLLLMILIVRGRTLDAFGALSLLVLANPVLFRTDGVEVIRYLPLLLGLAVLWPGLRITSISVAWALTFVAAFLLFNVLAVSLLPSISLFKGFLFISVIWILFNTVRPDWEAFARRLDSVIPVYLLLSFLTYFVPAIGFARNGRGFQGLTNQPQVFGVLVALFSSWLLYRLWVRRSALPMPLGILTVVGLLGAMLLSQARTALLGFAIAFLLTWLIQSLQNSRRLGLIIVSTVLIGGLGVLTVTQSSVLTNFIFKNSAADDIAEAADTSRGFLIRRSLENFEDSPVVGIGFGTPSFTDTADITYAPIIGIPISVALEKGVWVTATLEEQGIVGMAILVLFFCAFLIYCVQSGAYMGIPMLGFVLASNLGEMNMYSMGGLGLLLWLLTVASARVKS